MTVTEPATGVVLDLVAAEGEGALVPERVIVSPATGTFRPLDLDLVTAEGEVVREGQAMGIIEAGRDEVVVQSRFHGFLMGMLAHPGERVREGQPVAWIRAL